MVLRYKVGSGPFGPTNTQIQLLDKSANGTAKAPVTWTGECTFGQVCQSGASSQSGGATIARADHTGYQSLAGFVSGYGPAGASASWSVLGAPAGPAQIAIRYGNGNAGPKTLSLVVNGAATQVTLPTTPSWNDWATVTVPVDLAAGTNKVALTCGTGDSCSVNVDDIGVSAPGTAAQPFTPADPLGGYIRSYDSANGTYALGTSCATGQSDTTCTAAIPAMAPGVLDQSGWYLLDDTATAVRTADGWVRRAAGAHGRLPGRLPLRLRPRLPARAGRPAHADRPAPLLPEWAFGNWFSQYHAYTRRRLPEHRAARLPGQRVPLDTLSVDTDWKAPNRGPAGTGTPRCSPIPQAFLAWAKSRTSTPPSTCTPRSPATTRGSPHAQAIAGNNLAPAASSFAPSPCAVFDWSKTAQAAAISPCTTHSRTQGVRQWWLD